MIAGVAWAVSGVPTRFAQVLVLATPCPLLIAAPVAYIAGTGRLAAAGVLIKAQDVLENLGRVTQVFFDKPVRSPSSSRRWCASRCCPALQPVSTKTMC